MPDASSPVVRAKHLQEWLRLTETLLPARKRDAFHDALPAEMRAAIAGAHAFYATFVRWLPKGFAALFRDCGTLTPSFPGPERARILYEGIPAVCAASPAWVESLASAVEPVFAYSRVTGVVRADRRELDHGRFVLDLEWTRARP